jgi:hypothetical protein
MPAIALIAKPIIKKQITNSFFIYTIPPQRFFDRSHVLSVKGSAAIPFLKVTFRFYVNSPKGDK